MNQACQSGTALGEILSEAGACASCVVGPLAADLFLRRIELARAPLAHP
jgi:hypothetical protein